MTRQIIRDWKRSVAAGLRPRAEPTAALLARESALSLLQRSIGFGHGRLAVVRLALAVQTGADVPVAHWNYCRQAASASRDLTLKALLQRAECAARSGASSETPP